MLFVHWSLSRPGAGIGADLAWDGSPRLRARRTDARQLLLLWEGPGFSLRLVLDPHAEEELVREIWEASRAARFTRDVAAGMEPSRGSRQKPRKRPQ